MAASLEHYEDLIDALPSTESLTVLVVTGADRDEVAGALGVDSAVAVDPEGEMPPGVTAWALLEVSGGILASEPTGYGDPAVSTLVALSQGGRAAAVVRANIQVHDRFGCARDGVLLFDDDEYPFIDDPDRVPDQLRSLFDLVWEGSGDDLEDAPEPFAVGLAMAEQVTGIRLTETHAEQLWRAAYFRAPALVYPG